MIRYAIADKNGKTIQCYGCNNVHAEPCGMQLFTSLSDVRKFIDVNFTYSRKHMKIIKWVLTKQIIK